MFGLKFREQLTGAFRDEIEQLVAALSAWAGVEHNEDGTHGDVTADTISIHDAILGEPVNLPYSSARFFTSSSAVWTVDEADVVYLRATRLGQLVLVQFNLTTTGLTVDTSDSLFIRLPELHAIPNIVGGSPAYQIGGILDWQDVTNATNGTGLVSAQAQTFAGTVPSTVLQLDRVGPTNATYSAWAISADFSVTGSIWFALEPNNIPTPFFGS
jgi:hypothetical protein